jgi:hypothetical protein
METRVAGPPFEPTSLPGSASGEQIAQFRTDGASGLTGLRIPFFSDAFSRASGLPEVRLLNFVGEATPLREERPYVPMVGLREIRYSRPGIVSSPFTIGPGPIRGLQPYSATLGIVSGNTITDSGGNALGTVTGTDLVRYATSGPQAVIVADGVAYLYNYPGIGGNVYTALPTTVLPPVQDVAYLAGRFVYVCRNSATFYWSDVNDASSIEGLNFASNQIAADTTLGVAVLNNQLAFFGTQSVEFWSPNANAGPTDPAFLPSLGTGYQRGCASRDTIGFADNALFWVGENGVVYRTGSAPMRISSSSIEDKLRQCADLAGCSAIVATFEGHEFYVLNVPGIGSYAYDISRIGTAAGAYGDSYERGEWCEWSSYGRTQFRGRVSTVFQGRQYIGDDTTNDVGVMKVGVFTDYGGDMTRQASAFIKIEEGRPRCDSLILHGVMGVGNATDPGSMPTVEMRYSDDGGRTFAKWRAGALGPMGQYLTRAHWQRLGMMRAPGRLIEVRCSDPVNVVFSHLELNAARPAQ